MTLPPALLDPSLPARDAPLMRVGWLVSSKDIHSASQRYRCYHMARVLAQSGIESLYYKDQDELIAEIQTLEAIICVKRMDPGVVRVAAEARRNGVPLFLDFCDDLLSERYARLPEVGLLFAAVAPHTTGVTVPSPALAARLREAMEALGTSLPPVHVIPDIAETRSIYHLTEQFVGLPPDKAAPPPPEPKGSQDRRQVLWYGNYGSGHSNFGIFSLAPVLPALAAVHKDLPLELVVLSNNEPLFGCLIDGCGFPVRYIPWSPAGVYDALDRADVVLNTSGTDAFCAGKSANRPLQALAAGVPVVSDPSPALAEFEGAVMTGQFETNLRRCLGMEAAERYASFVAPALPMLERYSPQAIAGLWRGLLAKAKAAQSTLAPARPASPPRLLAFVEPGTQISQLAPILKSARKAKLSNEIMVTTSALADANLRRLLADIKLLPRVLRDNDRMTARLLTRADALCLFGAETPAQSALSQFARQQGIPVLHGKEGPPDWAAVLPDRAAPVPSPPPVQPGPHPEVIRADGSADWLFVVHPASRGWILDAISREIGSRQLTDWAVAYNPRPLPQARTYFFTHYSLFQGALRRDPAQMAQAKSLIWYTHPRSDSPAEAAALLTAFEQAHRVIFACSEHRDLWVSRGLPSEKGVLVLGGADSALFTGHQRGGGVIGLSSSFYERKNPDVLRDLVRLLPHHRFHLLGRNWERYALFEALRGAPNFRYDADLPYSAYPEIYRGFDVFLSMSKLEGGPIPLLEAMTENAVPVASRTGFAPDLIQHGENGYLFDTDAPATQIAPLIEEAFQNTADIRASVLQYDWESFARRIVELAQ